MRKINVTEKARDLTWSSTASVGMVPTISLRRPEGPNELRRPPDIVTVMKRTSRLCDMVADTTKQGMITTGRKESWQHDTNGWGVAGLRRNVQALPIITQLQVQLYWHLR